MTKREAQEAIRVLRPSAQAFERAKQLGLVELREDGRLVALDLLDPGTDGDPAQLPLF